MQMYWFNFCIDTGLNGPATARQVMGEGTVIRPGPRPRLTQEIPEEWTARANAHRRRLFAREPCTEGCRPRKELPW